MLTQTTLDKIVYEYQHGGVKSNHPELTTYERKALLKHLFSLPAHCNLCEQGHTHAQACRVDNVSPIRYNSNYNKLTKEEQTMTITYSLWDGAQLLGVDFKASSADEMNKTVAELQKVSKNVVAHMRKVEQN